MQEPYTNIFTEPIGVAFIWPVIFVLIQVLSVLLVKGITTADGDEKYLISYMTTTSNSPHKGKGSINTIIDLICEEKPILNIERLPDHMLNVLNFGPDLSIAALSTYFSLAFTKALERPDLTRLFIWLAVMQLFVFVGILIMLRSSPNSKLSIWGGNLVGLLSMIAPFYYLGELVTR